MIRWSLFGLCLISLCGVCRVGRAQSKGIFEPPAEHSAPSDTPTTQPLTFAQRLQQIAKPAVCEVTLFDSEHGLLGHGSGFVVSGDGFIITNAHVVKDAFSARVVFPELKIDGDAQLWQVWPDCDLALLRFNAPAGKTLPALKFASAEVGAAEDVWALGFPLDVGFTITRGIVNGVRDRDAIHAIIGEGAVKFNKFAHWVQIDCNLNPGNSGGPLLNSDGDVVGINTWKFTEGDGMYFAISAMDASRLFASKNSQAVNFPKQNGSVVAGHSNTNGQPSPLPPPPAEATAVRRPTPTFPATMPSNVSVTLSAPPVPSTRHVELTTARQLLVPLYDVGPVACGKCGGDGKIDCSEPTGTRRIGMTIEPVFHTWTEECPACHGTGKMPPKRDAIQSRIETAAEALCACLEAARPNSPGNPTASSTTQDLFERWQKFPHIPAMEFGGVDEWSVQRACGKLLGEGKPVILRGTLVDTQTVDGHPRALLRIDGMAEPVIAFDYYTPQMPDVSSTIVIIARSGKAQAIGDFKYHSLHGGLLVPGAGN